MAKARQQYFSDEVAINKEARTFTFDEDLLQKISDIDTRAEENVIEIVKVNSVPLVPDAQKAVNVLVPLVVDDLETTNPNVSLSARQWKILYDYILNLMSRWRFLSNWDCANWVPVTEPFWTPYNYNAWDYYVVWVVDDDPDSPSNFRPYWATYVQWWTISEPETETVELSDMYVYDWTEWILTKNSARQIVIDQTLSTTSTNAVENRVITNELNNKQDRLTAWANIQIDPQTNTISATDTTYQSLPAAASWTAVSLVTTWEKYTWNNKQNKLTAWANIQINGNTISATNSSYSNLPAEQWWTAESLVTTWDKYRWNHKQDALTAWANIQINNWVISATDTVYSAWDNITIDNNNVISATDSHAVWGGITWALNNQTDLQDALDAKQNLLAAWANIQIMNDIISATDTKYTGWEWIYINPSNEISNSMPFDPDNIWTEWQVLKKTLSWYEWDDESWGWGWASVDNTPFWPSWDGETWTAPSQNAVYDKIAAMDITIAGKQDALTAGENIQINWNVISATDTTYTAADFDIKDLADSSHLRDYWSGKQDYISDLSTIREWAAKWMTALQPGRVDNVSELINDAWYITKAVNDLTYYYNKNETYTKTEVDNLIANFAGFRVVSTLPATGLSTLIYLLWPSANDTYEEYIYTENHWVKIGETTIDLTNYFHKVNDDSDDIIEGSTHLFMTPSERTNLSHQSGYNTWDETKQSIQTKLGAASSTKSWYLTSTDWNTFNNKLDRLTAWANIQINGDVISATDTTYDAWSWISINWTTISNTKQFNPSNNWSSWQVLTKTSSWYRWETSSWGGGWWVTSVNWQTWAVTVNEFDPTNSWTNWQVLTKTTWNNYAWTTLTMPSANVDTKYFYLWDESELRTQAALNVAQQAYDWLMAWKYPVIWVNMKMSQQFLWNTVSEVKGVYYFHPRLMIPHIANTITFIAPFSPYCDLNDLGNLGISRYWEYIVEFTMESWVITKISLPYQEYASTAFLSTSVDYTTPYQPLYDGSPATKKYVDDKTSNYIPVNLTFAQSLNVDMSQSLNYVLTLTDNCTLSFSNLTPGQVYQIVIIQDANGWHRITLPASFKYASWYAQDTTANSVSKLILDNVWGNYFASITRYS